jgi:hypothetical protein
MMVNGVRDLGIELKSTVIETLTAILEVFRIAAEFAKSKRFSTYQEQIEQSEGRTEISLGAYADALSHPGKGGPEKQSLEHLKELGKRQNTQVNIKNFIAIDALDQKHDKTDGKIDFVSSTQTTIISTQSILINEVSQMQDMLKERTEDWTGPKGKRCVELYANR